MINDFKFEIDDTSFDKLKKVVNFKFSTHQRIGNFNTWQDVGKYEETIGIDGVLIVKRQEQLKAFELMAREKKPLSMVFVDGTVKTILILDLESERSSFLKDGLFLKQTYKISLAVVEDDEI